LILNRYKERLVFYFIRSGCLTFVGHTPPADFRWNLSHLQTELLPSTQVHRFPETNQPRKVLKGRHDTLGARRAKGGQPGAIALIPSKARLPPENPSERSDPGSSAEA